MGVDNSKMISEGEVALDMRKMRLVQGTASGRKTGGEWTRLPATRRNEVNDYTTNA
jgi:hypothetical protein